MSNAKLNPNALPDVAEHSSPDSERPNPEWATDSSTPVLKLPVAEYQSSEHKSSVPDSSWSAEQLKPRIIEEHNLLESFSRKTAIHTYRLGHLLSLAYSKLEYGKWTVFLQQVGISTATDNRARTLYGSFKSEDELAGLKVTEGYEKAGISIGKKTKAESVPVESSDTPKKKVRSVPITTAPPDVSNEDDDDDTESNDKVDHHDGGNTSDDDNDDDGEFSHADEVVSTLEIVASELDSVVTDRLPNIRNEEREEVRLAIQKVSNAHQRLLDAFFNGSEPI